jgi:hypothetical protein
MIHLPNDESEVINNSPLLAVLEPEVKRCNDINSKITEIEFELVEKLLEEASIEGFNLSFPSEQSPNKFPLKRISPSYCSICDCEHTSENAYIMRYKKFYRFYCYRADQEKPSGERKPSIKLTLDETALSREKNLPAPVKLEQPRISDPNDHFVWGDLLEMCDSNKRYSRNEVYEAIQATIACVQRGKRMWILKVEDEDGGFNFEMEPKLDLADYKINIIEYSGESVKLLPLINQAVTKRLIRYRKIVFQPYPPNITPPSNSKFFNLFLGFKAKPASHINYDLVNPIIWHIENIWCSGDKNFFEYVLKWFAFLV